MPRETAIPIDLELAILDILEDRERRGIPFYQHANQNPSLFGEPSSQLRRKSSQRFSRLKSASHEELSQRRTFVTQRFVVTATVPAEQTPPPVTMAQPYPDYTSSDWPIASGSSPAPAQRHSTSSGTAALLGGLQASNPYMIDLDQPHRNDYLVPLKGVEVEDAGGGIVGDKITVYLPVTDLKDKEEGRFKAKLSNDGRYFILNMPSVPDYFVRAKDIQRDAVTNPMFCEATDKTHRIMQTKLLTVSPDRPSERTIERKFEFPILPGNQKMTCNNNRFNVVESGDKTSLQMKEGFVINWTDMYDKKKKRLYQLLPYVYWEMAVDAQGKRTKEADQPSFDLATQLANFEVGDGASP